MKISDTILCKKHSWLFYVGEETVLPSEDARFIWFVASKFRRAKFCSHPLLSIALVVLSFFTVKTLIVASLGFDDNTYEFVRLNSI